MSALRQQRMNVVFDALIAACDVGATKHDLYDAMVADGCFADGMNRQVVNETMLHLRKLLASTGVRSEDEVVTCEKASHKSTYKLALAADDARTYRRRRAAEISTQVGTLIEQVQTERSRFAGSEVFTQAAVDYLNNALRELDRAGTMSTV